MKKLSVIIVLGIVAVVGASRLMGSMGYRVPESVKGKAGELKGKAEQAVSKVTGSDGTQARGQIDEATGRTRETIAEIKDNARAPIKDFRS